MIKYEFETSCVSAEGDAINDMKAQAQEVSLRTIVSRCQGVWEWAKGVGYDGLFQAQQGLALANDYHVSYGKSRYLGRPCYFIQWSGIEYIWTAPEVIQ